jgi:hypothetical protein
MSGPRTRLATHLSTVWNALINLNLFKKPYADHHERRKEIISTRFYIIMISVSMIILILYASLIDRPMTIRIESATLATYRHLVSSEPTLRCTCSKIITSYSQFISLAPIFHPVCSSAFVVSLPDPYYFFYSNIDIYLALGLGNFDFRIASASLLAIFQTFCSVSHGIVDDLLKTFLNKGYVNVLLTREDELLARAKSFISTFQEQTPRSFNHLLQLIQDTTRGLFNNQLIT